jgi:tripartite-type tricarboxylate transporter receptor subunit TctC
VPTSPGGLNDLTSRALAAQISDSIGQSVLVENRPGAGSMIGMSALAKSAPDGYTVGLTTGEPLTYNPLLFTRLPYDPDRDFAPVSLLVRIAGIIVANPSAPAQSFPELLAYARANPGKLNYATWGPGSIPGVYLDWINRQNGVNITAVPYKGAGPAVPATIAGEVHLTYIGLGFVIPQIKAGKLKPIAVATTLRRSPVLPDVPLLSEFNSEPGLAAYFGVWAPARTPPAIVERLSAEFVKALHTAKFQELALQQTMETVGNTPPEFAEFLKEDRATAARVYKTLGIKPSDVPAG